MPNASDWRKLWSTPRRRAMTGTGLLLAGLGLHRLLHIVGVHLAIIFGIAALTSQMASGLLAPSAQSVHHDAADAPYILTRSLLLMFSALISMTTLVVLLR